MWKRRYGWVGVLVIQAAGAVIGAEPGVTLCEPWQAEYAGDDATGATVIGLWSFNEPAEGGKIPDASGHGHAATLVGATIHADGRFNACLETSCGWPKEDKPHRVMVANHPALTPPGGFTVEMWLRPKPELASDYPEAFLLDKKYVAHDDYQLILSAPTPDGTRVLRACLGFGQDSASWYSRPLRLEPGIWHHLAFTYDGAGTGCFLFDGASWGEKRIAGRGAINPGKHGLSIGDRIGSYYHGFPGFLDQVRLSSGVREFRRVKLQLVSDRTCFVRRESPAMLRFSVTNLQRVPVDGLTLTIGLDGLAGKQYELMGIAAGASASVEYPLDTTLRSEAYDLVADLDVKGAEPFHSGETIPIRIVPRSPPGRFPVLMWGIHGGVSEETERLKRIGFTHVLGLGADYDRIWQAGAPTEAAAPPVVAQTRRVLDDALANGLTVVASLSPGSWLRSKEPFRRVDRQGQAHKQEDICGLFPELQPFCRNVGLSVARSYGDRPAFGAALIHTEVRDHAQPCFHPHDAAAFRAAAGVDVPAEAGGRAGVDYHRIPNFPVSRVIPDDHPLYVYYRWYWKQGDGWNGLNTAVAEGLKAGVRSGFWTFHDPAVRVASVYGSGGDVDVLSQWTYSYPDPIRIGVATDELLAMAGGSNGRQQVMKMTQIIWYRGQTAPIKKPGEARPDPADWELRQPDAPFITIAPLHLREAFWTKIARPIKGIMYHGWQSLVPCEPSSGYRYTHPQTQDELARLIREVVRPLGPTLLQVPPVASDVAFLESFASQMFAHRGTYGWGGNWTGDAYQVLLWAHLQPEIVYDETIVTRGLDGFRVLVMPDCDVLTRTVVERIQQFQARGGLVIGDANTAPAIKPDIVLRDYKRTGRADQDKAALLALATELRQQLDARYTRRVDCSNPEIIPYRRAYRDADYVFVVNDRREYGHYVGQHGLVMENGLPSDGTLSIARANGFVYDLVDHVPLPTRSEAGRLAADVQLGPCDGRLYLVSSQAIGGVRVETPAAVKAGESAACRVQVVAADGTPFGAIVPVEVEVRDAEGRLAEFSGAYVAVDGRLELKLDIAGNDTPGTWQVSARELASNRVGRGFFRVLSDHPAGPAAPPPAETANPVQPKG